MDTGNPQKVFACHAYNCQLRGNLLTLMHGWLTGTRPTGDKLKGEEFNRVRRVLAGDTTPTPSGAPQNPASVAEQRTVEPPRNFPLAESANEKARELQTLDEKFPGAPGSHTCHLPPRATFAGTHAFLSH